MDSQAHYGGEPPQFRPDVQPVELIAALDLNFLEGNVIKYVARWRKKDGVRDLYKARQYLDWLISLSEKADIDAAGGDVEKSGLREVRSGDVPPPAV